MPVPNETITKTKTVLARIPYLNCAPFFDGWPVDESWEWVETPPRQFGVGAEAGRVDAGPMALADYVRLKARFERIAKLGIAVRGRCGSTMLFSQKPIRQLDDATIAVTDESSTTALLLRLILEQRYELHPKMYRRGPATEADAVLLIGDEALKWRYTNRRYPYEIDLAFEWWLWQHLPAVFAVWVVRNDCISEEKQRLTRVLHKQLATNLGRLEAIGRERAGGLGIPADDIKVYLENFIYRFSDLEEQAIARFESLLHEHHLL